MCVFVSAVQNYTPKYLNCYDLLLRYFIIYQLSKDAPRNKNLQPNDMNSSI